MRPTDAFGRQSRPAPESDDLGMSSFHQVTASQSMSYCVADESAVDASLDQSFSAFTSRTRHDARKKDRQPALIPRSEPAAAVPSSCSMTGVEEASRSIPVTALHALLDRPLSPPTVKTTGSTPPNCSRPHQQQPMSTPMTPILLGVSGPGSTFSGLSSRRDSLSAGSLSEELGSMVGASEEGSAVGEDVPDDDPGATPMEHSAATAPQLVMPSIKMPSRRPFTDEGKAIGRLKVLIAGEKDIGKTSLIKSIVQCCEHIVHLDPIEPTPSTWETGSRTDRAMPRAVTEIHGSTKAYPEWWADLDESRVLKRRNSLGDVVINRNICFVDTIGYGNGAKALQDIVPVVQYIESHLERMYSNTLSDSDLATMIGGDGGPQVDVVLYLISHVDLQYLRMLAPLTNIIPLIAKSDTIAADEIWERKQKVLSQLLSADVRPFRYSKVSPTSHAEAVLSVSSATGSDSDLMDASLLMSPDYVEPLLPSELGELVRQVFSADGASWLRHSTAKKCLQWRSGEQASKPQALYRPLNSWPPPAQGQTLPGGPQAPSFIGTTGELAVRPPASALALAPATVRREEQLAQIRLANWAVELQRSLDSERARYEALARGERAVWLTERLGECVKDGTLVAIGGRDLQRQHSRSRLSTSSSPAGPKVARRDGVHTSRGQTTRRGLHLQSAHSQDPLGILEMLADMRARSWVAFEVLGSIGVFGGLALWVAGRYWHVYPREDLRGCFALLGCNGEAAGLFTRNNVWT
uniref:Septin-type G domain-containing protein n=1 Tax=Pyricularia oryzae (strain P131) TaxID=1143193 RepID=L7IUR4_PYRO1